MEYVDAGKRPDVCKNLLFTDEQIMALISYQTSLSKSERSAYAYYPTSNQHYSDEPSIDIEKLLTGGAVTVQIPYNNTDWLIKYGWLPGYFDAETGFYYESIEPFVPGIKCNETDQPNAQVYVELASGKPQMLYKQTAVPGATIHQQRVKFSYETNASPCAGEYVSQRLAYKKYIYFKIGTVNNFHF